jgi:hypothetical protein
MGTHPSSPARIRGLVYQCGRGLRGSRPLSGGCLNPGYFMAGHFNWEEGAGLKGARGLRRAIFASAIAFLAEANAHRSSSVTAVSAEVRICKQRVGPSWIGMRYLASSAMSALKLNSQLLATLVGRSLGRTP